MKNALGQGDRHVPIKSSPNFIDVRGKQIRHKADVVTIIFGVSGVSKIGYKLDAIGWILMSDLLQNGELLQYAFLVQFRGMTGESTSGASACNKRSG